MLEVIAQGARDGAAAQAGGAARVELVGTMADGGLSASVEQVREFRAHCDLPIRAMLRDQGGFAAGDVDALADLGAALLDAGAQALVLGYLAGGELDTVLIREIAQRAGSGDITIHRAVDSAQDYFTAWERVLRFASGTRGTGHVAADARAAGQEADASVRDYPHVSTVLTAGSENGVETGMPKLLEALKSPGVAERMMVGGGLKLEHIAPLREAGVRMFHVGSAVRDSWDSPVDPERVKIWVDAANGE
ncbi:copper homeostasis protein [Arcanobacterium wilhelmae]|uniref:Copper homeostasis protein cutC homolog n=1 Tax=Arcanobacterium wilhelmae TaxID=1803177 RepID=A0ABT9NAA5_9ACTO|nr:copper homeostasis protein CutC [Arcanobacterium wilhelmae]MDP9800448.1 copper homeostasis protein [Arcanobacterium wilhelmae]WFN89868.1 copper homeostasis protein CutC [Arcanobacterium wilhelmae]